MIKILIAADDRPASEKVVEAGLRLSEKLGAEMGIVSVVDSAALMTDGGITPSEYADMLQKDIENNQRNLIGKLLQGRQATTFIRKGLPSEGILGAARDWEADIIVVGTHGRKGLSHFIMGSVAETVIRHSTIPVFVVPVKD